MLVRCEKGTFEIFLNVKFFSVIVMFPVVPFIAPYHLLFQHGALFATFLELALFPDPFRFVFVSAAMTFDTVLVVINAFFQVFSADPGAGVLVAAVAQV